MTNQEQRPRYAQQDTRHEREVDQKSDEKESEWGDEEDSGEGCLTTISLLFTIFHRWTIREICW